MTNKKFEKITLYVASDYGFLDELLELIQEGILRNTIDASLIDWAVEEFVGVEGKGE